jgi:hypothetical protein
LTVDQIGYPDEISLDPAEGAEIAGTAVDFSWDAVPEISVYAVDIFDADLNRIF